MAESAFDEVEDEAPMVGAHEGGEVEAGAVVWEEFEKFAGVAAGVDDGEGLWVFFEE